MNPRTPTCPSCGDKFPGAHCKKCGFEEGGIQTIADRETARRAAKTRVTWQRHYGNATSSGTPRATRKRRRHGVPVR